MTHVVRELVLASLAPGTCSVPEPREAVWDELMHQLSRLLNNLQQLHLIAEEEGDHVLLHLLDRAIHAVEQAVVQAPTRASEAAPILEEVIRAGRYLNEMTHEMHASETLPDPSEVAVVLSAVIASVQKALA
jgi:uncharacterized protein YlaN (UPF0358 family)